MRAGGLNSTRVVSQSHCLFHLLKGIVHTKMQILSSFNLKYFQTCMNVFVLLNTKEDILKNVGNSSSGEPLTSIVFFFYYGSQWCPKTAWLQIFFKISSFVFSRTKIFIQVWKYLKVSKWWHNLHFWVNYTFKSTIYNKNSMCDSYLSV